MFNVVNPDDVVEKYGADTLRLYEMFLGPIEQSKPWDTAGIDGSHRFLKKFWGLYYKGDALALTDDQPKPEALKSLHKLIKKVTGDIEAFSYNTAIPAFMIAVSELQQQKCTSRAIMEPMVILIAPFAPHIAEELWHALGHDTSVCNAEWPRFEEKYLVESTVTYPISFSGKVRFKMQFAADTPTAEIEAAVLANEETQKWMNGQAPKKVIVVPGRIVNIVI